MSARVKNDAQICVSKQPWRHVAKLNNCSSSGGGSSNNALYEDAEDESEEHTYDETEDDFFDANKHSLTQSTASSNTLNKTKNNRDTSKKGAVNETNHLVGNQIAPKIIWAVEMVIGDFTTKKSAEDFRSVWLLKSRGINSRRERGILLVNTENQKGNRLVCYDKRIVPKDIKDYLVRCNLEDFILSKALNDKMNDILNDIITQDKQDHYPENGTYTKKKTSYSPSKKLQKNDRKDTKNDDNNNTIITKSKRYHCKSTTTTNSGTSSYSQKGNSSLIVIKV